MGSLFVRVCTSLIVVLALLAGHIASSDRNVNPVSSSWRLGGQAKDKEKTKNKNDEPKSTSRIRLSPPSSSADSDEDDGSDGLADKLLYSIPSSRRGSIVDSKEGRETVILSATIKAVGDIATAAVYIYGARLLINGLFRSLEMIKSSISQLGGNTSVARLPDNIASLLRPNVTLNAYEFELATSGVLDPKSIKRGFKSIGGLRNVKQHIKDSVYDLGLAARHRYDRVALPTSGDTTAYPSILLFGPPGCGKSLLSEAACKFADVPMLSIAPSNVFRKYYGETNQMVRAIFSLAHKIQPCILFIDEIDALFRVRSNDETQTDRSVKTECMTLWDQVDKSGDPVIIIGATNRPQDLGKITAVCAHMHLQVCPYVFGCVFVLCR
jgi:ATPase family associated with various cellular activities (AAA)